MAEAGEWTTTKLINLILGIILLVIIIVGSLSGQLDPLIDQVGAKFDEWTLKTKQTQRDSEIMGDFEVNPDGTCKLLNEGVNKDNYTFDYYTDNLYLNDLQVNNKIIEGDLESLKEERELYYAIIQKLEEEDLIKLMGKESPLFEITAKQQVIGHKFYKILAEDGLYFYDGQKYCDTNPYRNLDKSLGTCELYPNNNGLAEIGSIMLKDPTSKYEPSVLYIGSDLFSNIDLPSENGRFTYYLKTKNGESIDEHILGYTFEEFTVEELKDIISTSFEESLPKKEEFLLLKEAVNEPIKLKTESAEYLISWTYTPTSSDFSGAYPKLGILNAETGEEKYAIQFTSNSIYFSNLITEKDYSTEDLNKNGFLLFKYSNKIFLETPNKEYILNDETFNEMIKLNEVYQYMVKNCV